MKALSYQETETVCAGLGLHISFSQNLSELAEKTSFVLEEAFNEFRAHFNEAAIEIFYDLSVREVSCYVHDSLKEILDLRYCDQPSIVYPTLFVLWGLTKAYSVKK